MLMKSLFCTILFVFTLSFQKVEAQTLLQTGDAVVTCFAGTYDSPDSTKPVVAIIDVRDSSGLVTEITSGSLGTDEKKVWKPQGMYHDSSWTAANLGQVFGIALDENANIYLAATTIYGVADSNNFPWGKSGKAGTIYKLNGVTGKISIFTTLPNNFDSSEHCYPGLGNITYDGVHKQLFATDFEDGKIYRIRISDGNAIDTLDPLKPDDGSSGFAPLGERLWGIGIFADTLYYSVYRTDRRNTLDTTVKNEIRSVLLDSSGNFIKNTDTSLFFLPPHITTVDSLGNVPKQLENSSPVSDISLSIDGTRMLLAERTMTGDVRHPYPGQQGTPYNILNWAHHARVLEYSKFSNGWKPMPEAKYKIGEVFDSSNASGGVDFGYSSFNSIYNSIIGYDSSVWATGDALNFITGSRIYGLQELPETGGDVTNSVLINLNNTSQTPYGKTQIGAVKIFKYTCPSTQSILLSYSSTGLNATIYPNPISSQGVIRFGEILNGKIFFSCTDMLGRIHKISEFNSFNATNLSELRLDCSGLSNGTYYYSIKIGELLIRGNIVVIH